jgi:Tol biopolymer transport system component
MLALAGCGGSQIAQDESPFASSAPDVMPVVTARPATPLPTPTVAGAVAFAKSITPIFEKKQPNTDIYVVNTDGSGLKRLTDAPGWEDMPSWSPDGSRILYNQWDMKSGSLEDFAAATHTLWVMNADGSGKTCLTDRLGITGQMGWSPDGRQILSATESMPLCTVNVDGSGMRAVGDGAGAVEAGGDSAFGIGLEWLPDGRLLALRYGDAVAMDLDGGNQVKITEGADLGTFAMSPDGERIVLADNDTRLLIAPVRGEGAPVLLARSLSLLIGDPWPRASWSPDSRAVAIADSTISGWVLGSPIYIFNADGSGLSAIPGVTKANDVDWRPE